MKGLIYQTSVESEEELLVRIIAVANLGRPGIGDFVYQNMVRRYRVCVRRPWSSHRALLVSGPRIKTTDSMLQTWARSTCDVVVFCLRRGNALRAVSAGWRGGSGNFLSKKSAMSRDSITTSSPVSIDGTFPSGWTSKYQSGLFLSHKVFEAGEFKVGGRVGRPERRRNGKTQLLTTAGPFCCRSATDRSVTVKPPITPGKYRVYSVALGPYAQRVAIVLLLKNVPHDIVTIDLQSKPDWYFNIHSQGKVPTLDTGEKVVVGSADIVEFQEKMFSGPHLYPAHPKRIAGDCDCGNCVSGVPHGVHSDTGHRPISLPPINDYYCNIKVYTGKDLGVGSSRRTPSLGNIHTLPVGINVKMKIKNCRTTEAMCHAAPCYTYLDEEAGQSLELSPVSNGPPKNRSHEVQTRPQLFVELRGR
ncbi:hypothetical protein PR048_017921 [Dryococelus australis]|uniref:GST N-terminal domain-containing protein n=1 Tax=Dryococelus australis TaxID=614101 RepID=A0ABQ9HB09_9NEOP|nr:hypothetical protein PR048_017921 [Dryococelus australis]